jgi:hypothetical protein
LLQSGVYTLTEGDQAKFDVFNALSLMDNWSFLSDLKVSKGSVIGVFI